MPLMVPDRAALVTSWPTQLGGSRIYGPLAIQGNMLTGAFRDPAGNLFGVYQGSH